MSDKGSDAATLRAAWETGSVLTLGLSLAGAGLVLAASGFNAAAAMIAALMLMLGMGASWITRRGLARERAAHAAELAALRAETARSYIADLDKVCASVLPVWSRQVEAGRSQTEEAITALAARFSNLSEQLQSVVLASQSVADGAGMGLNQGGMAALFATSRRELDSVLESLRGAARSRDSLASAVHQLLQCHETLQQMATAAGDMVERQAALQVAVAAEQDGEARTLVALSAESGRDLVEQVGQLNAAIVAVRTAAERSAQQDAESMAHCEGVIGQMAGRFQGASHQLAEASRIMQQAGEGIRGEIAGALVSLQFQDRVSQILCHIRDDISKLETHLNACLAAGSCTPLEATAWLNELSKTYTTDEQRALHGGGGAGAAAGAEITFF